MTTLIVTPIDMSEPGSFRQRSRLMRALAMMRDNADTATAAAAYVAVEDIALQRLETDDGTPVEDALDLLSADQFDQLLQSIAGENAVPTESGES
jgi:hypothetical protein